MNHLMNHLINQMDEASIFDHGNTKSPIPLIQQSIRTCNPFQQFVESIN